MTNNNPDSPWTRPGFAVAAVIVGLVVILGLVIIATSVSSDDDHELSADPTPTTPPPATADTPTPTAAGPASDSVCGLTSVDLDDTLIAPPPTDWSPIVVTAVPHSDEHGPGVIEDDGFRYCYSRTPTGALFAAATVMGLTDRKDLAHRMSAELTVPGPGREAAIQQDQGDGSANLRLRIEGFRMLHYDGDTASVDLAIRTGDGRYFSFVWDLRWTEGDWMIDLLDIGQPRVEPGPIPDITGYISWSEGMSGV